MYWYAMHAVFDAIVKSQAAGICDPRQALRNCTFKMAGKWKECIEDIRVPDTDTRKYRYLELLNQLKVVLISDEEAKKGAAALTVQAGQWGRMIYIVQAIQALVEDQSVGGLVTTTIHCAFM